MSPVASADVPHPSGEFHAKVPGSQPAVNKWHKPGNEQGNEAAREFHAEVHPQGEAPPERSFKPNPTNEFTQSDYVSPPEIPGATSKDVHTGLGLPLQGMESREVNPQLPGKKSTDERAHTRGRKKEESGLVGVGAEPKKDPVRSHGWDLPEGVERGMKGKHTAEYPAAEERVPETA